MTVVSDNWNAQADGSNIGPLWTDMFGDLILATVVSPKRIRPAALNVESASIHDQVLGHNQAAECKVFNPTTGTTGTKRGGPIVRYNPVGHYCFAAVVDWTDNIASATTQVRLIRFEAGTIYITAFTTISVVSGSTIRLEALGDEFNIYINGALVLTDIDTFDTGGFRPGIWGRTSGSLARMALDDWLAEDLAAPPEFQEYVGRIPIL